MTAETLNVPSRQGASRPPEPAAPARPSPVRGLWARLAWRCALVPLIVLAPLVAMAPTADHRFNVYQAGGLYRGNPLLIVPDSLHEVTTYLRLGNFRPLGRIVERSLDLLAYLMTDLFGVPANVALRLVSFGSAIVLTLLTVLFTESLISRGRLRRTAPSTLSAMLPYAVAATFVAAGRTSTTVLFGGLYLLTTALVLGVGALVCRVVAVDRHRLGRGRAVLAVLLGAGIAAFNELAYLAVPLVVAAVLIRGRWVLALSWRRTLTGPGARAAALIVAGFLPVAGIVRQIIHGYCTVRSCYESSAVALTGATAEALPVRMLAWLPPLGWQQAVPSGPGRWLAGLLPALALGALAGLAWRTTKDLPLMSTVDRRQAVGLSTAALVLLTLAAAIAALSGEVQAIVAAGDWGRGWRDSGATAAGGMLVLLGLSFALVVRPAGRRRLVPGLLTLFVLASAVTAAANRRFDDGIARSAAAELDNRIALEVTDFDTSAAGNLSRCALLDEALALSRAAQSRTSVRRYPQVLDLVAERKAGRPFCLPAGR
ncbi:MAG: hypothetical protein QOE51_3002 [Actinoplanes sp.]|nr:hypothetical protein [Actinoplanes sp.]